MPRAAVGLPDPTEYGDLSQVAPGQLLDYVVQRHEARRAGLHHDLRFGSPETGLHSWAVRKGLPLPGQKHLAVQQPLHAHGYQDFEGEIPSGYGAGRVSKHDKGQVLITKAGPKGVHFTTAHGRFPERYALVPFPKAGERSWLLINTTKTEAIPYEKKRYVKVPADQAESVLANLAPGSNVQAKLDGAASLTQLYRDHAEVVSYRARKDGGGPIVHTERLAGGRVPLVQTPASLTGTVLRGELYGVGPDGRAIPPQELGGLLNSSVGRSLTTQRDRGQRLRTMVFDIERLGGQTVTEPSYAKRREMLQRVLAHLPADRFHLPEQADTPEAALALWRGIKGGTNPLTREGVVVHPAQGPPQKLKLTEDYDVHIHDMFPGQGKYQGKGVGGFRYSHTPGGPVAGEVGSGLSDETRRMMHEDPDAFVGRVAKVRAQEKLPSGALRAPSFLSLHEDVSPAPVKEAAARSLADMGLFRASRVKSVKAETYVLGGGLKQAATCQATPQTESMGLILKQGSCLDNLDPDCGRVISSPPSPTPSSEMPPDLRAAAFALRELQITARGDRAAFTVKNSQGGRNDLSVSAVDLEKEADSSGVPDSTSHSPVTTIPSNLYLAREPVTRYENPQEIPAASAEIGDGSSYSRVGDQFGVNSGEVGGPEVPSGSSQEAELSDRRTSPYLPGSARRSTSPLATLLEAKAHSDRRRYAAKHALMRRLIRSRPGDFVIDSDDGRVVGVTHVGTGFRMHLPKGVLPTLDRPLRRLKEAGDVDA